MDRYDDLDLDLECDGGGVAQKAALFGGMFKKSLKSVEPSVQAQQDLSDSSELSKSNDSLTDKNAKGNGGVFKGMFKKTTKSAKEEDNLAVSSELSKSSDSLTDNSTKDNGNVFKGMFKKTTKSAKDDQAQVSLSSQNKELSASDDSLLDKKSSKDKSGVLGGILKRSPKPGHVRRPSQDLLDKDFLTSENSQPENGNAKETGGMFSGIFKKPQKPFGARAQSQDDLSASSELSGSSDSLSVNRNAKESSGGFSAIFKKPFARTKSQDDLSEPSEHSGSSENLQEGNTKEKGGIFSGVFKKPKHFAARSQSQEDLTAENEISASSENLAEKSSKGGIAAKLLKNPFSPSSQGKDKPEDSGENTSYTEKPKAKQNGFSAVMKSTFSTDKQEKSSDTDDEDQDNGETHKQSKLAGAMTKLNPFRSANKSQHEKLAGSDDEDSSASSEKPSGNKQSAVVGAMSKLNPFRSATKKEADDAETLKEAERQTEEKPKSVTSNMIHWEKKERSETPAVPPRLTKEEVKGTSTDEKVSLRGSENIQGNKDMTSKQNKEKPTETPVVPARPSVEELKRAARPGQQKQKSSHQNQSDDETLKDDNAAEGRAGDEANKRTKKKHKHHNPFLLRAAAKAASDDEGLKEEGESSSKEENEEAGKAKAEETKVKKPKRHNPFMPRVKTKATPKKPQDAAEGNAAENESGNRSLFDQLEEFRIDPSQPEGNQDAEELMEWWNTVEPWEDTPQDEDLTEKEEAKAFAVTADKVQKGIRVFNKLFSERAESLWQHVIDLNGIAEALDKFNKNTKIAQITGGSTSAIGGVATIAGLALAPVTMGTSLIVTAVGLGVATAGGLTSAGAGISNQVNNSMDRKKVEKIVEDYQEKILDLNKCLKFIKQGIENLRKFDLLRIKNHAYNRDFPVLSSSFYEDGAMAGKAILINANEIMRVVQIANVAGSTAARAVQIASMATGVLTGLFVGMDIYFVAKDSKELKKGAKSEFAAKIREVALQLHEGLVELNTIREELQSTTRPDDNAGEETAAWEKDTKNKVEDEDSSEDEIDRIKKAIKKDMENREYV